MDTWAPVGDPAGDRAGTPARTPAAGGEPAGAAARPEVPPVRVETTRMADRVVALPVREVRYSGLHAVKGGLAWLRRPVTGTLGLGGAQPTDDTPRPCLERFDFAKRELTELVAEVDWFQARRRWRSWPAG